MVHRVELHKELTLTPRFSIADLLWHPFNCSVQSRMSPCFPQLVGLDFVSGWLSVPMT